MPMRLWIGNLDKSKPVDKSDLEDVFGKFGNVVDVWVARQPPGFAFVTFDDDRDAKDALEDMDGATFQGEKIRVQVSKSDGERKPPRRRDDRDGSRSRSRGRRGRGRRRSPSYSEESRSPESRGRGRRRSRSYRKRRR
mmetsp:Transcript_87452/g.167682  ORF Transcript_87452/g.167682 Transcript_87452/m.167682 type:complete len:138 (-) Transcript_87452:111-524(-)